MTRRYALGKAGTERSTRRLTGVVGARPVDDPERDVRGELVLDDFRHPAHLTGPAEPFGWGACHGCGHAAWLLHVLAEYEDRPSDRMVRVAWCLHCLVGDMGWWPQAAWPTGHPQFGRGWRGVDRPVGRVP